MERNFPLEEEESEISDALSTSAEWALWESSIDALRRVQINWNRDMI